MQVMEGTLTTTGWSPFIKLAFTTTSGDRYIVQGPLEAEMTQIGTGWLVKVAGSVKGTTGVPPTPALEVYRYQISGVVTPQGVKTPILGYLQVDGEQLQLVDDQMHVYTLDETSPGGMQPLQSADHARVAVVGDVKLVDGRLHIAVELSRVFR